MVKTRRNFLLLIMLLIISVVSCFTLIQTGALKKIEGNVSNIIKKENYNVKPKITMLINSSGENKVDGDVVLTIDATSDVKISKIEYSTDKENWLESDDLTYDKEADKYISRIIFTKNINKTVYVRAVDEYDNESYYQSTVVNIEK